LDVLVVGRSCLDYLAVVPQYPAEDTKIACEKRLIEAGGQGGTAVCCISRLGGQAAYIGRLGNDDAGLFCLKRLEDFNVESRYVHMHEGGRTPVAYILVSATSGKRTIIYEKNRLPPLSANDIPGHLLNESRVVLLDPEVTYLAAFFLSITQRRPLIIYDCERWRPGVEDMMRVADYFVPSADFLDDPRAGLAGRRFLSKMVGLNRKVTGQLVVTRGDEGAYYWRGQELCQIAVPAVTVKDSTGAGDNFHAALALAISRRKPLPEAVKFAVAVASLSCRAYGGREGIPTIDEAMQVAAHLSEQSISIDDSPSH
jgi:sugar/nucleoside kinase (ribokinase family)